MSETSNIIMITKNGDKNCNEVKKLFHINKCEYGLINFNSLNLQQRRKLIIQLFRKVNDIEKLFFKSNAKYKHAKQNNSEMKVSELIQLMSKNPAMLRTPIIYRDGIITNIGYYSNRNFFTYIGEKDV